MKTGDNFGAFSPLEVLSLFVLKFRQRGLTLPTRDLITLKSWLLLVKNDENLLLVVLSDLLPQHFEKTSGSSCPPLCLLDKKVRGRIADIA